MNRLFVGLLAGCLTIAAVGAHAADKPPANENRSAQSIAYRPPLRGAPLSRVGGGTRSIAAADLKVEALAPEHLGLSAVAQPTFYWYSSKSIEAPVEFALVRPGIAEPIAEVRLKGPFPAGIHAVDTHQLGLALDPATDYEWFISVVFDEAQRSNDVTAGAAIRYADAQDELRQALAAAGTSPTATDYAAAGFWYDSLSQLSQTDDAAALGQRAELLRQVGLNEAADATD